MINKKQICRCGDAVENIKSYFHPTEKLRVTVCDKCAERFGLKKEFGWEVKNYNELTEQDKKTPDAANG